VLTSLKMATWLAETCWWLLCNKITYIKPKCIFFLNFWLAVHHSITFLLLPTWYTNFLFIHINYIKLNSSTCFERNPLIIRRSTTQIVHMPPLVSSLSASDRLVQPLRKVKVHLLLVLYVLSYSSGPERWSCSECLDRVFSKRVGTAAVPETKCFANFASNSNTRQWTELKN